MSYKTSRLSFHCTVVPQSERVTSSFRCPTGYSNKELSLQAKAVCYMRKIVRSED